jgi:cation transport regulator ChaC
MVSTIENLTYSTEDWMTMQTAHMMASAILQRDPTTHENADRLARTVMKLFDQGMHDRRRLRLLRLTRRSLSRKLEVNGIVAVKDKCPMQAGPPTI